MPVIERSGSKIRIFAESTIGIAILTKIAQVIGAVIQAGNDHVAISICFSEKLWPVVHAILHGG